MAATAGTVEATAITGTTGMAMVMVMVMVMVILAMVIIITAIAIISTFITAAGNGAPTARSMSAAIIDSRPRKKLARAERLGRVFRFHDDRRDRLPPNTFAAAEVICRLCAVPVSASCPILTKPHQDRPAIEAAGSMRA
jgi:hypothetical protein